jgi:hypothetical protein
MADRRSDTPRHAPGASSGFETNVVYIFISHKGWMASMNFLGNILASIIAGILVILGIGIFSKRARWILTAVLGHLLDVDIEYVYRNGRVAATDVANEIQRSAWVSIMAGRGNELQRETFAPLLGNGPNSRIRPFKILLPKVDIGKEYDWTKQREDELARFDRSFGHGVLKAQIGMTIGFLKPHLGSDCVQLRLCSCPHLGRILITDRTAFFTSYSARAHGRESRVYKYGAGGDMYQWFCRLFDQVWEASDRV